jgi:hypothetical protein
MADYRMSGQLASLHATHAAILRAVEEQRLRFAMRWGGVWTVTPWGPTMGNESDPDAPWLQGWANVDFRGAPEGVTDREWTASIDLSLVESPLTLRLVASIDLWRHGVAPEMLVTLPERAVTHDDAPAEGVAMVSEILDALDGILHAAAEPQAPRP